MNKYFRFGRLGSIRATPKKNLKPTPKSILEKKSGFSRSNSFFIHVSKFHVLHPSLLPHIQVSDTSPIHTRVRSFFFTTSCCCLEDESFSSLSAVCSPCMCHVPLHWRSLWSPASAPRTRTVGAHRQVGTLAPACATNVVRHRP